jgi:hypothetical protein
MRAESMLDERTGKGMGASQESVFQAGTEEGARDDQRNECISG